MDGAVIGTVQSFLQDQDIAYEFSASVGDWTVISFEAEEDVNGLYKVQVEIACPDSDLDLHALIDTQATLSIHSKYSEPRYWTGIIETAERGNAGLRRTLYSLTLRPPMFRLTQTSDCRIYQELNVPSIVKSVFKDHGLVSVDWRLSEPHETREFCCQYNETAFAFVQHLLNEEGIFWFWSHKKDSVDLIVTDAPLATPILPNAAEITYNTNTGGQSRGFWISSFSQREKIRSNAYEITDYTFKTPAAKMNEPWRRQEDNGSAGDF